MKKRERPGVKRKEKPGVKIRVRLVVERNKRHRVKRKE